MSESRPQEHILCAMIGPESTDATNRIREAFSSVTITWVTVPGTFDAEKVHATLPDGIFKDITILCTYNAFPLSRDDAPNLRWVQLFSAGSNQVHDLWFYKDSSDVTVTTVSGIHAPQIAEWVVMTALVYSRRYNSLRELQKAKQWGIPGTDWNQVPTQVGRRLGVIGYGSIGRQVARVASAMGIEVLAYTATVKDTPEKRKDHEFVIQSTGDPDGNIPTAWFSGLDKPSLHHFLEQDLDWIVISVPLTPQTRHLLSSEEFSNLRQGGRKPLLTNIARGAIIDQDALITALKDGTLGGAALDVTDPEPLSADSELWDLENVIITPHVSGNGTSYRQRAFEVFETNLQLRDEGRPMINVVNRERGY